MWEIIHFYNSTKGGVILDHNCAAYSVVLNIVADDSKPQYSSEHIWSK